MNDDYKDDPGYKHAIDKLNRGETLGADQRSCGLMSGKEMNRMMESIEIGFRGFRKAVKEGKLQ